MQEASKGNQKRVVWWTAHPRADVEYRKDAPEKNEMTKREFWDKCTEEDRSIMRQFADAFQATWEEK